MKLPIRLTQIQAIQGLASPMDGRKGQGPDWRRMRKVPLGLRPQVHFGPSAITIDSDYRALCGPMDEVVLAPERCQPRPKVDRTGVEEIAAGVAEGLRRAPLSVSEPAPWVDPGFRGTPFPQDDTVALNTFGNTAVQTVQVQQAIAGYLGTTNYTVATVNATAGTPAPMLAFRVPDNYVGRELLVACQDQEILYLSRWTVTVNGKLAWGPGRLVDGRAGLNVQATRGQTVAVNIILATGDVFAVGVVRQVNGFIYPSPTVTDGTYGKSLRTSPSWAREENL